MKNQHGLNEGKKLNKEKNDLSIELSDVARVVSLGTNNQVKVFKESGDMSEEAFQFLTVCFYSLSRLNINLQMVLLSGYVSF
jgi:hypothetical protein